MRGLSSVPTGTKERFRKREVVARFIGPNKLGNYIVVTHAL